MTGASESAQEISPELLELLVCPIDKSKVELKGDFLVCTQCGRKYPIENGIPNMLADDEQ